jgi:tRNA pseudouridine13 synthase
MSDDTAAFAAEIERLAVFADVAHLPRAHGNALGSAVMRTEPADFYVSEFTGLQPSGTGEHWLVQVRKTGQNTRWVAKRLAELIGVPYKAVSYAGMKDRHAVTEQWFGVHLPGQADPQLLPDPAEGFAIIATARHDRKLRPGQLSYNRFRLRLRSCNISDRAALDARLALLREQGVPNYFGAQRFGHAGGNLRLVQNVAGLRRLNRERRAFALSALRGALFNGYLAGRVAAGNWHDGLTDDVLLSDRSRGVAEADQSVFVAERIPAGLLWGKQSGPTAGSQAAEAEYFAQFPQLTELLVQAGSKASRRVLKARLGALTWNWLADDLVIEFALGPGSYATMVLRELLDVTDAASVGVVVPDITL